MLENTTNIKRYAIEGEPVATYDFNFPFWSKSEIKVYLTLSDGTLTELVEETDYTLSSPSNTGRVTRVGTWEGGTHLTIVREIPHTQNVNLRNGDRIDAETIEESLDNITAQIQQVTESISRTVITSIDEAGGDIVIPNKTQRIGSGEGTLMGFGADGNSVILRDVRQFDLDVASAASNAQSASQSATLAGTYSTSANQSKLDAQSEADRAEDEADRAEAIANQAETDIDEYVTTTVEPGINTFAQTTSRAVVEAYVESTAKAELDSYTTVKEGEITTHTEGKKGELDTYVNSTSKPSIATYVDGTSKPAIDSYFDSKKAEWQEKIDAIHVSNPNLLDNGWFTVNQRGMTSYNINGYGLDRWRTDASVAVTLGNNGVTVASSYLKQIIDSDTTKFLLGRTVTVSVLYADGVIKSGTGVVPSSIPSDSYARVCSSLGDEIILQGNRDGERLRLIIQNSTVAIRAVKLELGDTSTLAYDSAPDYATELLKCQRYYKIIYNALFKNRGTITAGVKDSAGFVFLPVEFATTMRGLGAVSLLTTTVSGATVSTGDIALTLQDMSFWSASATPQGLKYFTFSANSSISMASGTVCQTSSDYPIIAISADL